MNHCYPFVNTPLPFDFQALEPFIDEKTMFLHHDRHLQTYIDNLNSLMEENPPYQTWSLEKILYCWSSLPAPLQIPFKNNSGGIYNHRFFFEGLTDTPDLSPGPYLSSLICKSFQNFETFKERFKKAALEVFGSGYVWLVQCQGKLLITQTANQDTPLANGQCPLLNLDVWEHAYYLKHYNVRAAYIDDWFHVVNWNMAEQRLQNMF